MISKEKIIENLKRVFIGILIFACLMVCLFITFALFFFIPVLMVGLVAIVCFWILGYCYLEDKRIKEKYRNF